MPDRYRIGLDAGGTFTDVVLLDATAVFLHAYKNPAHEQAALAVIREAHPRFSVSLSSEVVPEIRELERTCPVAAYCAARFVR